MNRPTKKFLGESWVGWLNILILQWFFIRLYYTVEDPIKWGFLKRVIPLSGWGKNFKYI